jgi:hypothetical protein
MLNTQKYIGSKTQFLENESFASNMIGSKALFFVFYNISGAK